MSFVKCIETVACQNLENLKIGRSRFLENVLGNSLRVNPPNIFLIFRIALVNSDFNSPLPDELLVERRRISARLYGHFPIIRFPEPARVRSQNFVDNQLARWVFFS